jgi:hypothetical protein
VEVGADKEQVLSKWRTAKRRAKLQVAASIARREESRARMKHSNSTQLAYIAYTSTASGCCFDVAKSPEFQKMKG